MNEQDYLCHTARVVDLQQSASCAANDQLASVDACDAEHSENEPAKRDFPAIGAQVVKPSS